jgi:hypothetical protein
VALPDPVPDLVIGYAYLWRNEALRGQEEALNHRPCVIVLAVEEVDGEKVVIVAPITHAPPRNADTAVELPATTRRRLGLDDARSWIITDDLNRFIWPGVDLRPTAQGEFAYGLLPRALYERVRESVLLLATPRRVRITPRT